MLSKVPSICEVLEFNDEDPSAEGHHQKRKLIGGETIALKQLDLRLKAEEEAFISGHCRPLQSKPDLISPPLSMSAAIAIGAISVRL